MLADLPAGPAVPLGVCKLVTVADDGGTTVAQGHRRRQPAVRRTFPRRHSGQQGETLLATRTAIKCGASTLVGCCFANLTHCGEFFRVTATADG